jgi:hypothetical protein
LYNIGTVVSDVYVTLVADIFYSSYYWNNHHMWALFSRLEQFNSWNNESYSDAQIPSFPYHTSFLFSSKFTILDDSATNYNIGDVLDIRYVDNNHFETKIDFSRIQISGMNQPTFGFAYTGMSLWDPSGGYGLPDFSQSWTSD